MSDPELVSPEEAKRLREDASDGPWDWDVSDATMWDAHNDEVILSEHSVEDAALIAAAPSLALTVEVQAWRIAELERQVDAMSAVAARLLTEDLR